MDYLNESIPAQDAPATTWVGARHYDAVKNMPNWKDIGPRLGVNYDVFGTGRTAIKGTVSRYVSTNTIGYARLNNPLITSINSTTRAWTDANGDFIPQLGELGPLANSSFGQVRPSVIYDPSISQGWGVRPGNWEYSAGFQHEVVPGLGVDVAWFRRVYFNFYALVNEAVTPADFNSYCITAPSDSRLPSNVSGSQICGLYDITPSKFGQISTHAYDYDKYGGGNQSYNGFDIQSTWRRGSAFLQGGISAGSVAFDLCSGDFAGSVTTATQIPLGNGIATSETLNFPNKRFCNTTYPYQLQGKLSGAYTVKGDIQLSGTFQTYPGPQIKADWTAPANVANTNGGTLGRALSGSVSTVSIPLVEPNTLFGERRNQLDIRVARNFRFGGNRKIQVLGDLYNVMNSNPVVNQNNTFGTRWLEPTNVLIGRFFKLGFQLQF
jgi:hypothetical protein